MGLQREPGFDDVRLCSVFGTHQLLLLCGSLPGVGDFPLFLRAHLSVFVRLLLFVQGCLLLLARLVIRSADLLQL